MLLAWMAQSKEVWSAMPMNCVVTGLHLLLQQYFLYFLLNHKKQDAMAQLTDINGIK